MGIRLEFDRRPSAIAYHVRALLPSPGLVKSGGFLPFRARWRNVRLRASYLTMFREVTGLSATEGCDVLLPQVLGFPLLMTIVTHPAFPLSIWNALQVRNSLLLHRPLAPGESSS